MLPSNPQSSRAGFTRNLLHLYTLSAFGIAQPLFDRLSGHVTYLLDRGITRGSVVLLASVLVLVVPTLLAITQVLVRLVRPQWQRRVQSGLMGLLLVIIACPFARHLVEHQPIIQWGLAGYLAVAIALSAGVLLTMAYHRTTWLSRWISWASPAIALFPLYFLLVGPAMTAVFPRRLERRTVRSRRPVPVVMVVFDAFCGMSLLNEEHRIDPIRYPHLAHLAASATWYRNATTVHSRTPAAVPAILTGAMPHGVNRPPTEAEYPQNLFRVLQDSG